MSTSEFEGGWQADAPLGRVALGLVAGLVVFATGVRPTGNVVIDLIETVIAVAVVVVVGARAPWWMLVAAAGIAGAVGLSVWPILVAVMAFALAAWVSPVDADAAARADVGAFSVSLTMVSFSLSELDIVTGASAMVGIGTGLALIVGGLGSLTAFVRKRLLVVGGVAVAVAVAGTAALGVAANGARDDLGSGVDNARAAARQAADLEADAAADDMRTAASDLEAANERIDAWWTQPARLVPIVAQHRTAAADLTEEVSDQLDAAADDLEDMSLDRLQVVDGAVDIDALRMLAEPVERFAERIDRLGTLADEVDSVWLAPPVKDKLDEVDDELVDLGPQLDRAQLALESLPAMLGENEARRYLLLFTTPSEARGLGGFIGNYAIVSIDDGRLRVDEAGRRSELERVAVEAEVVIDGPPGLLATYGKFGLGGDGEPVGPRSWSNLTLEPDWPSFASAAHQLYNDANDDDVHGVVVMDPYVLGQLSEYTGPVETNDGQRLEGDELVDYILLGQYASEQRLDELETLSTQLVDAFLDSSLPKPRRLARDFEPLVDEQRLLVWAADETEQAMLVEVGVGDGLPDPTGRDAFTLALNNSGGNKIDAFLEREVTLERAGDVVRATVELTNEAPTDGYTDYVIGNLSGLPTGTSRLYLVAYTSDQVDTATVDGAPAAIERGDELGWSTSAHYVVLGPGERTEVVYEFPARSTDSAILERLQPLATRE
ncbi:uncharacterized protein DUF4012 [Ilumatobacter fluminis]|uniref:Uncharacterized protein DUF4012 n=1 Tax=Ilumatobacter fluminis TaxID=467091 RepID=A0A4R7HX44_9ACTN|nr:DUF4012 domain-containing protein [Ilumatobacter fluminis]TDT15621.1 uncharacterized protein DUF4012 [Ilumatobacter fluminis]